ncbi:radical SAM protein [Nitratidesulfovibrio sp. HK-II]|uniref:radical SAM protein n=1 Tax=Nitratidesulfovibrio sp. HK-II TaxID=2009266 RepID=UPI000E2FCF80|nr:molybdenum cofactor biosynthesis protein MoaA [Nitratidesulfovibrio sp. HK-II]
MAGRDVLSADCGRRADDAGGAGLSAHPHSRVLARTASVCPVCLGPAPAERVAVGDMVLLVKRCPEHGEFSAPVWRGEPAFTGWVRPKIPTARRGTGTERALGCPRDCGLCPDHGQHTCTLLIEVTQRCNLRCPVCFASAGQGGGQAGGQGGEQCARRGEGDARAFRREDDPTLGELVSRLAVLRPRAGDANIQLSGGEPTLRDDLPQLIAAVRGLGYPFVQLNTNGLRLARETGYAGRLAAAGLDSVFLQFDGPDDAATARLRGLPLHADKVRAVDACASAGLGVVLVCTVARGVNDHCLGDIVRFGLSRVPVVRGAHFQPVSFFGRYEGFGAPGGDGGKGGESAREAARITLPEVMRAVRDQTDGLIPLSHLHPPGCEHAQCSFSGTFTAHGDGTLEPAGGACCGTGGSGGNGTAAGGMFPAPIPAALGAERARAFVRRQWRAPDPAAGPAGPDGAMDAAPPRDDFERFLARAGRRFTVSGMAFQDAWTLDTERLRGCCIHVAAPDGRMVPFCAWNLTSVDGTPLHRNGAPGSLGSVGGSSIGSGEREGA